MKNIFLTSMAGIGLSISICLPANGQLASNDVRPSRDFTFYKNLDSKNYAGPVEVNARVIRSFVKTYTNVSDEKWFELRHGIVAMFRLDDVDYQVAYDKKGNLLRTIRTYREGKLSRDVRHAVKTVYYDYDINVVQEIEIPLDPVVYIVQLLGKTELINISVCNGETAVLQKFNRSE
jgi:hypothetical protein